MGDGFAGANRAALPSVKVAQTNEWNSEARNFPQAVAPRKSGFDDVTPQRQGPQALHVQAKNPAGPQDARGFFEIVENRALVRHMLKDGEGPDEIHAAIG